MRSKSASSCCCLIRIWTVDRLQSLPDRTKPTSMRSQPVACDRCSKRLSDLHKRKISVHHGELFYRCGSRHLIVASSSVLCIMLTSVVLERLSCSKNLVRLDTSLQAHCSCCSYSSRLHAVNLLPPRMKLRIFADMPWSVRLGTCFAPLRGKSPKGVIEPRVGDPDTLPFDMLYRQMLELVRPRLKPWRPAWMSDRNPSDPRINA